MAKHNGFIALLDVLGFTSLISGENASERLESYQLLLSRVGASTGGAKIESVIFSDSIVLTTSDATEETFLALALCCSQLMGTMLEESIPLRGAICAGSYFRSVVEQSAFVAGHPILEAHRYERIQDWVGIMIAPSALDRINDIDRKIVLRVGTMSEEARCEFFPRIGWAAAIQAAQIPFHDERRGQSVYHGYAVVPRTGGLNARAISNGTRSCYNDLEKLRKLAPDPSVQDKYVRTQAWLWSFVTQWESIANTNDNYVAEKKAK